MYVSAFLSHTVNLTYIHGGQFIFLFSLFSSTKRSKYVPKQPKSSSSIEMSPVQLVMVNFQFIQFPSFKSISIYCIYTSIFLCSAGFSVDVVEENGRQQLHITDVKSGGLAFAKGV